MWHCFNIGFVIKICTQIFLKIFCKCINTKTRSLQIDIKSQLGLEDGWADYWWQVTALVIPYSSLSLPTGHFIPWKPLVVCIHSEWIEVIDAEPIGALVLLDLSAAFDTDKPIPGVCWWPNYTQMALNRHVTACHLYTVVRSKILSQSSWTWRV